MLTRQLYYGIWPFTKKELTRSELAQLSAKLNLMNCLSSQFLLKQYITTLLSPRPIFATISPRLFGEEFSAGETQQIYEALKELLKEANAITNGELISTFASHEERPDRQLHWFVFSYWQLIVELLDE